MSTTFLLIGSVIAVLAIVAVLAIYLFIVGSVVNRLAGTLERVAGGAAEIGQHVASIAPVAAGVHRGVGSLAHYGKDLL